MNKREKIQMKYVYRSVCSFILMCLATAAFLSSWIAFISINNQTGHLTGLGNIGMAAAIYFILYFVIGKWMNAFKIGVNRKFNILASQVLALATVDVIEILVSMAITGQFRFFHEFTEIYFLLWLVQSLVIGTLCVLMVSLYRRLFPPLQLLEVYGSYHNDLSEKINAVPYKYHITMFLSYKEGEEAIRQELENFDAVLINDVPSEMENRIIKMCFDANKRFYLVPKISDIIVKSSENLNLFDTPLLLNKNNGISFAQRFIKRFFDIVLSGIALVVLSPILLITAIAIHMEDGGPVFFTQKRCTYNLKEFEILKFRSMIVDAEKDGRPHPAGEKDPRITKVGNIIRATRIDELPQLINILKGDMSIVGPRPERIEHVHKYMEDIPEFSYRYKVKGGLTGYAQVYGKYNTTALDKLKLDLIYITSYSLLLDLQIIFETVKILFQKDSTEGFTQERQEEMHDSQEKDA